MTIDWNAFTPWSALAGGILIGVASIIMALFNGRIAGISGILGGLLSKPAPGDSGWRLAFLAGMILTPLVWMQLGELPAIQIDADYPLLIGAGLLVGISTRYGSGCTSGHGVCGVARLSPRSLIATVAFMGTGFITVYVVRHVMGG